jgi:hypothetical protein
MEQRPGDGFGVELHLCQDRRHRNRVHGVGLARLPKFRPVCLDRELSRSSHEFDVPRRSRLGDCLEERVERDAYLCRQRVRCRRGLPREIGVDKRRRIIGRSFRCKRASR